MQEILELEKNALDVVKSRYLLCILVAQRIHQLEKGAPPVIEVGENEYDSPKSYYELALREIDGVGRLVDQHEPQGDQRIHQPDRDAVQQQREEKAQIF